jgi:hypothetical protein
MSGDYSRFTDRPPRRYTGVRMQQGRVQLDADWNEEVAILKRRWETQAEDTFGPCAVPEATTPDGFKVSLKPPDDLALGEGRIYVHGRLAEIFPGETVGSDPVSYLHQPFLPDPPALPGGSYVVYLDVWDREVTYIEDPDILEKALGGPDTATRIQTVWQVRVQGVQGEAECGTTVGQPASTGRLSTRAIAPPASDDPCILSPTGGYRGVENRLYRVEVHDSSGGTTRFKWSRENASVVSAVTGATLTASESRLTVTRIGRDAVLRFQIDDWVEVLDDNRELNGQPGQMLRVKNVIEATRTLVLDGVLSGFGATPADLAARHTRVRRWDQKDNLDANGLIKVTPGAWVPLEDGVEVRFSPAAGTYHTGDHWSFAARTVDGSVEELKEAPPLGIHHFYCQLAAVNGKDAHDCRLRWPDGKVTDAPRPACCSLTVSPGEGWESVFKKFTKGQDVSVCFAPGTYRLTQTLELAELGQVKIEGAGTGTKILAPGLECALRFRNCRGVLVSDLAALTGIARSGRKTPKQHLNGTLTFEHCGPVTVSDVTLQCGGGDRRAAACITVMGKPGRPLRLRQGDGIRTWASFGGSSQRTTRKVRGPLVPVLAETADAQTGGTPVRIRGCELKVGRGQVGILVVDGQRIQIEDNNIAVVRPKRKPTYQNLIRGRSFRAGLRSQLISALQINPQKRKERKGKKESPDRMTIEVGGQTVRFETAKTLRSAWSALLEKRPLAGPATAGDVASHLYALADEILLEGPASTEPLFRDQLLQFQRDIRPVASQGIVIGGRRAGDVRILNNSVTGVLQGVHLGLSHKRQPQPGPADLAGRVRISGNRIVLLLAAGVRRERHGIFLGSVDSAIVDDNHVQVVRFAGSEPPLRLQSVDGIRVFGWLGALLLVEHNHLVDCTTGVLVHAFNPPKNSKSVLWKITRNVLVEGGATVVASGIPAADVSDNRP